MQYITLTCWPLLFVEFEIMIENLGVGRFYFYKCFDTDCENNLLLVAVVLFCIINGKKKKHVNNYTGSV